MGERKIWRRCEHILYENGQLILRAKFAYALNYSTAPASGNTLAEVVVVSGRQDFVLSEGYLKSNFSTWNKVKNVVSAGLDFIPVVGNIKGAIEGIVGYDLAGNKLTLGWGIRVSRASCKLLKKGYRAVKALNEIDKFADIAKDVERVEEGVMDISKLNEANKIIRTEGTQLLLEASKNIHKHHILPQKFRSLGLNLGE